MRIVWTVLYEKHHSNTLTNTVERTLNKYCRISIINNSFEKGETHMPIEDSPICDQLANNCFSVIKNTSANTPRIRKAYRRYEYHILTPGLMSTNYTVHRLGII